MTDSADWCAAVGHRADHHWTPEYEPSRESYTQRLWSYIEEPEENLTKAQVHARLSALRQILADLEHLVARACTDEIAGPSSATAGYGEWTFPVGAAFSQHPLGELRQPRVGCDEWSLHHRAYFGAPSVWPGALIWALLDFKPDSSVDTSWREVQDASIIAASESIKGYISDTDGRVQSVRSAVPPL